MKAEIFRKGINWFIEYYDSNENHMNYCGEWISGFENNPLSKAVKRARFWGCKSICIIF